MNSVSKSGYEIVDFAALSGVPCPCGTARRAFAEVGDFPATIHVTQIERTAQTHYHNRTTEAYYILECEPGAALELDAETIPLRPGMCVLIRPGVRHRAVGKLRVLLIAWPKFTEEDEVVCGNDKR